MNIGELDGVKVMLSPEAYAEVKKQKIIEENKILKELQQELERYKNIIDELEDRMLLKINRHYNEKQYVVCIADLEELYDRLKELKGSDE